MIGQRAEREGVLRDAARTGRFPEGRRHLAGLRTRTGQAVQPDLPGLRGSRPES